MFRREKLLPSFTSPLLISEERHFAFSYPPILSFPELRFINELVLFPVAYQSRILTRKLPKDERIGNFVLALLSWKEKRKASFVVALLFQPMKLESLDNKPTVNYC